MAYFADRGAWAVAKRAMREGVRFVDLAFEIAARAVAPLGLFKFSSLHVRRNELQYHEVKIPAAQIMKNAGKLFTPGEVLYISTDELRESEFEPFKKTGHKVILWKDLFTRKGGGGLRGLVIPRKIIGLVEQIICACGRAFVGTDLSTFTAYIFRLRGYIGAPDTHIYHATKLGQEANAGRPVSIPPERYNWRTFGSDEWPGVWQ